MKYSVRIFALIVFVTTKLTGQVVSDFEAGNTDNWHSEGDGIYYYEAGTGNPGGCFRVDDDATGDWNNAFAPVKFLGDWSSATNTDYIKADIFLHQTNGPYSSGTFVFSIKGPGGEARAFSGVQPPFDVWTTYTAHLNPADWELISGDWNLLMQQVSEVIVRAEYIQGDEYNRLDNIELSFTPVVVPVEPVICSDFEYEGYDGWSFDSTGGVTNSTTGGNPGHCIQISDAAGVLSTGYAPAKYLGDWTLLDNHAAEIRVDLKVSDFSGPVLISDYFIKISGPGGEAKFPMDSLSVLQALNKYKTFIFPVDENFWTVISGSWNNLMNNVTNFEIILEFIYGDEIVRMDNFCITDLPPVADFNADDIIDFVGNPVQFNDLSTNAPDSWSWTFGDGGQSTGQNPVHVFMTDGFYDIGLTVTNYFGSDNIYKPQYIEILPVDQCLKYEDDFNDNTINPVWHIKNGTWSESDGNIRQTSNFYTSENLLEGCFATTGSLLWSNYIVSCDMMSSDNDFIGLVWNRQDELNMYMFYWNLEGNTRRLVKWVNGVETVMASDAIPYTSNTWYHIEILSVAGSISLNIDGTNIFSITDNTFSNGKAGLFCSGNQSSYWDNFKVECSGTEVGLKAFLEGPYNGTNMNNELTLPDSQPFNTAPWNYQGGESVSSIPAGVVDWVLIELRDAASADLAVASTTIATKACFILTDGSVKDIDGVSNPRFDFTLNQNLFAVVRHRNHLDIISANALTQTAGVYTYDFTTSAGQAFGNDPQKEIGSGVFGMFGGDANADGTVNSSDKDPYWIQNAGKSGYYPSDFNLDGQSDNPDKNDILISNFGKVSGVQE